MSKNCASHHAKPHFSCYFDFFYLYYKYKVFPEAHKMMYKHWKKILLALTGFFWVSCDNDPSSATEDRPNNSSIEKPTPGSATSGQETNSAGKEVSSSSSKGDPSAKSSSAIAAKYGVIKPASSSAIAAKYGVIKPSSSSQVIAPKYGVSSSSEIAAKYGVVKPNCKKIDKDTFSCEDGVTCTEGISETMQSPECSADQICAKYGVVIVKDTVYKCDDGKVYNAAEFHDKYNILDGAVDLYGCPSDICDPSDTLIEIQPLYGIPSSMTDRRK